MQFPRVLERLALLLKVYGRHIRIADGCSMEEVHVPDDSRSAAPTEKLFHPRKQSRSDKLWPQTVACGEHLSRWAQLLLSAEGFQLLDSGRKILLEQHTSA